MLTGKQLVARTEYSFIASPLSLCMHHKVLTNTHKHCSVHCSVYVRVCMATATVMQCKVSEINGQRGERFVLVCTCVFLKGVSGCLVCPLVCLCECVF